MIKNYIIKTEIIPAKPKPQTVELNYPFKITALPIRLNLKDPIKNTAYRFLRDTLENYIDEDRELKTLLNFGDDRQNVILAKRFGEVLSNGDRTLQLKLLRPLPDDIKPETPAFISREVATTIIDKFKVKFAQPIDTSLFLRPKNTGIRIRDELGKSLKNVTLQLLSLQTGSVGAFDNSGNRTFEDEIYRRWYSYDFNSAELNLEFNDYSKFVFYGSATMRLMAFAEKMKQLEVLDQQRKQFAGDVFTGELAAAGASFILNQSALLAKQHEDIIRSFDRYEQYLYFTPAGSDSPYSASVDYVPGDVEYNEIGYWPKSSNNNPLPIDSEDVKTWLRLQMEIAQRFDEQNENNLINTIPTHIREDDENAAYFTFIVMIGHFFDLIKPYIDQFPYMHSRYTNPNEELSKDLIVEIAESVGFKMPALNSLFDLSSTILGEENVPPLRDFTAETHKRLLHNLALFAKTKGTKTALVTALRTLGISQQLIDVGESGISSTGSYYVFEEFTNGIDFRKTESGSITLPLSSSLRTPTPRSLSLNVKLPESTTSTIFTGDDNWSLNVVTHPTNTKLGRFEIVSGSNRELILSSSYYEIFDDQPLFISLTTQPLVTPTRATLRVLQTLEDSIIYDSSNIVVDVPNFINLWNSTNNIIIGGIGSISVGEFSGILDEFRLWGINLSPENIVNSAFNPNMMAGNTYDQASTRLYTQLSFNKIDSSLLPTEIINESPYRFKEDFPQLERFQISGITEDSFVRYSRTVREYLPQIGSLGYVTQKIKILPPANFGPQFISGQGVKQLSRFKSVVSNRKSRSRRSGNKVILGSSPTRIVNQNIIRTFGGHNVNFALGIPSKYPQLANTLDKLRDYYNRYYYVDVNSNTFIRIIAPLHGMLDQVVEYFIPSKASLFNGVIIEPNILEKVDIPTLKKMRFYGAGTRKTMNAVQSLTTGSTDYGATFNLSDNIDTFELRNTSASYNTTTTDVDMLPTPTAQYLYNTSSIDMLPAPSGSLPMYATTVDADDWNLTSNYKVYDRQHLQWVEYTQNLIERTNIQFKETGTEPYLGNFADSFEGSVYAIAVAPDGKLYVGGDFTEYNGISVGRLVRLNRDGTLDTSFNIGSGFNNLVYTLKVDNTGVLYVGGFFTTYRGVLNPYIIRLFPTGNKDTRFDNSGFDGNINAIDIDKNGKIYVGGTFTSHKGITANHIIRLNSNGTKDTDFNNSIGFNDWVYTLKVTNDNKLYVGGAFQSYKGIVNNRIIRLNSDGSRDTTFANSQGFNNEVRALELDDAGKLYVGGYFTSYEGLTENRIIRLNPNGTKDEEFDNSLGFNDWVDTLLLDKNNKLYVGGAFTIYKNVVTNRIIRLNSNGSQDLEFDNSIGFNGVVFTLAIDNNDKLSVGGAYTLYKDIPSSRFSLIDINGLLSTEYMVIEREEYIHPRITPEPPSKIEIGKNIISGDNKTIDTQHLDWIKYQQISKSYSDDYDISDSGYPIKNIPLPKSSIDMGYTTLNKIGYDDKNLGSPGAEPFNRIYPRKLFDYEINQPRQGGRTSLIPSALYALQSSTDFTDLGCITYFNNSAGFYYFPQIKFTPVYSQPLNAEWSFDDQEFISGVTTWQVGQRYKQNDVVFQNVSLDDALAEDFAENAQAGNGRYYIYKTKPAYSDPGDGSVFYLNDVPSYVPPSLDGVNWTRLRFRPIRVLEPRRIVFDTFTISEPQLNNFKTTTLDIKTVVDEYTRFVDEIRLDLMPPNGTVQGEVSLQNILALLAIQSNNNNIRVRLYRTENDRQLDLNRTVDTLPTGSHGVLLDTSITELNTLQLINPIVSLVSEGLPPSGQLYYTVNNLSTQSQIGTRILIYYFTVEIERTVPTGYLRKHYRFFRDNATATKRRNFEGCKFRITGLTTDGTPIYDTIDGLPPVQVFLGEGTEIRVASSTQNNEIVTGGGGTLSTSGTVSPPPPGNRFGTQR
jgi:uncharacterized delta-60 repeat protein